MQPDRYQEKNLIQHLGRAIASRSRSSACGSLVSYPRNANSNVAHSRQERAGPSYDGSLASLAATGLFRASATSEDDVSTTKRCFALERAT